MEKNNKIKIASILGIVGNVFLLIIKLIIGIISASQAMIADAMNSAGDIFASLMAFIGNKISTSPADEDHNMGHGKAEFIFSLFIAITMILVSSLVIYNSILNIINNKIFKFSPFLLIICLITIITKLTLYIYTKKLYKNNNSILLKSLYIDHRNDILITLATLSSSLASLYDIYLLDSIVGILISLWIIYVGLKLFLESYNVLMDQSLPIENYEIIKKIVKKEKNVKMGKLSSFPIGNNYVVVLTIEVPGKMTVKKSHDITKILQKRIKESNNKIDRVVIHVNPID